MARDIGRTIAVIPARGGSQRIPLKNVIDFHGKPMLVWTYQAAVDYGGFDRVVVSTEDPRIAEAVVPYGVEVPFLRQDHFDGDAAVADASICAVEQAEALWNERYDTVIQLMPTCPLRGVDDVARAMDFYKGHGSEHQVSCYPATRLVPWSALGVDPEGRPSFFPQREEWRRAEDRPTLYQVSGAIWVASRAGLFREREFYGPDLRLFVMSASAAIDIDTYADLEVASGLMLERQRGGRRGEGR